ncbi:MULTISPECIES: hypothetical protein [Pseudomonas]|uniref:hypothetical protein n=1 Tax=Pseudomonas TaxID=286 RepID=UPI000CFE7D9E|nr:MULTISPECIES: hypothetical protein [Pseudomonas]PRA46498.1 hypothetical protein CQZ98_23575 [Pseudomonas sp. MYb115]QXN52428.1 hypothetical protein KW062_12115 [Pseudomonas fluorescens]WSO26765.1 hypothetical protein VUJ50_12190 [Pseudomonas fluorescens]
MDNPKYTPERVQGIAAILSNESRPTDVRLLADADLLGIAEPELVHQLAAPYAKEAHDLYNELRALVGDDE